MAFSKILAAVRNALHIAKRSSSKSNSIPVVTTAPVPIAIAPVTTLPTPTVGAPLPVVTTAPAPIAIAPATTLPTPTVGAPLPVVVHSDVPLEGSTSNLDSTASESLHLETLPPKDHASFCHSPGDYTPQVAKPVRHGHWNKKPTEHVHSSALKKVSTLFDKLDWIPRPKAVKVTAKKHSKQEATTNANVGRRNVSNSGSAAPVTATACTDLTGEQAHPEDDQTHVPLPRPARFEPDPAVARRLLDFKFGHQHPARTDTFAFFPSPLNPEVVERDRFRRFVFPSRLPNDSIDGTLGGSAYSPSVSQSASMSFAQSIPSQDHLGSFSRSLSVSWSLRVLSAHQV